jgi:hypothetical protein
MSPTAKITKGSGFRSIVNSAQVEKVELNKQPSIKVPETALPHIFGAEFDHLVVTDSELVTVVGP